MQLHPDFGAFVLTSVGESYMRLYSIEGVIVAWRCVVDEL